MECSLENQSIILWSVQVAHQSDKERYQNSANFSGELDT